MARPKKEKELVREHRITIRLSDIEYELVCKQAEFPDVTEQMKAICSELHAIGNNLNQIAK